MATETMEAAPQTGHGEHGDHPTEWQYIKIGLFLAAVTAVEVLLFYTPLPGVNLNNAALGVLAVIKFVAVVGWFMHLKFDNRVLRRFFVAGTILALFVYIAVLLTMGIWI